MSRLLLVAATLPRLSAHRAALVALCVCAGVALAASSAVVAAAVASPPGLTVQVFNQTGSSLANDTGAPLFGSWAAPTPAGPLANGASAEYVAQLATGNPSFGGEIDYGPDDRSLVLTVNGYADPSTPFNATCYTDNKLFTCTMQNATKTTPWIATWSPVSGDTTPPAVQVRVAPSLVEESVRAEGVPVVVRSNEPARARVELLAKNGARHALLTRTLKWGNRDYPLMLRLNRAGLRALDVGKPYRLRVRVTDRHGNPRTIERHIAIR
jgi:hypothetical protein